MSAVTNREMPALKIATLAVSDEMRAKVSRGEITAEQLESFEQFLQVIDREMMHHPVVVDNKYTRWFAQGNITLEELRYFIAQFSVFSNQFLIAQLLKMINADSLDSMRASKEILANELGVIYRNINTPATATTSLTAEEKDRVGDPDLVATEGSVDGSTFRFNAAHFEWLLKMGKQLGMGFNDLGKRKHGSTSTLHFCDELIRVYGSDDWSIGAGASFSVENWAAAGFWKELIFGLDGFKRRELPGLSLAFFTWHDKVEDQHASHTMAELEDVFFHAEFDREKFLAGGMEMLDGVKVFWDGLNAHRLENNLA